MLHLQRLIDILFQCLMERKAGALFDDQSEEMIIGVGILKTGPRRKMRF
jgi:hypothetical protein